MEVRSIKPRSYCRGVVLAIRKALAVREAYPDHKVTMLGQLVHNQLVVDALAEKGIMTLADETKSRLELLEEAEPGIIIFSAHGVSDLVREKAKSLGLTAVDATCPEVSFTQKLVKEKVADGYRVFYVGKAFHPEAIAVTEGLAGVTLITKEEEIPRAAEGSNQKIFVTNQTTLSVSDLQEIFAKIRASFPEAEFADEICKATRMRQEAVRQNRDVDVMIVVGDPASNNTSMLAKIAEEEGVPRVFRIASAAELPLDQFRPDDLVGVTAGASTPPYLIAQVEDYLKKYNPEHPAPLPEIDLAKILE